MSQRSCWKRPALSPDSKEQLAPQGGLPKNLKSAPQKRKQNKAKGYTGAGSAGGVVTGMGSMACLTWRASTLLGSMSLVLVVLVCASMHHYRSLIDFKGGDGVALLQAAGRIRHVREHVLCIHSDADCRPTPLHEDNAVEIEAQKDQKRIRMQEAAVKNRIKALRVQLLRAKRLEHSKQEHVIAALKKATASVLDDTWRLPAKPASPPPTDVGATAPKPAPREEAGAHALRKRVKPIVSSSSHPTSRPYFQLNPPFSQKKIHLINGGCGELPAKHAPHISSMLMLLYSCVPHFHSVSPSSFSIYISQCDFTSLSR